MKEEKAQVNLEFLLVVVGGIVIVTAVALYIKSAANSALDATKDQVNQNP